MITVRKASERGHARHGWLESLHTFSFADYFDTQHMGFRALRVINEDRVQPGRGFGAHSHQNMEIVSYVIDGALEHRDSLGNGSVIRPGDVQRMSAGTGVTHSEYNPSQTELVHFLQIWILPERDGLEPSYEQKHFSADERRSRLRRVASRDGSDGSVVVHQDVSIYAGLLDPGDAALQPLAAGRHAWVQVVRGAVLVNATRLRQGDGAALSGEASLTLRADGEPAELLVFDLA
jgi:redox-sensitive bicupin YhaK (pirin superfamily)